MLTPALLCCRVDQAQLETVLPQPGGRVLVVNGLYRGSSATLLAIDTDKFQAQVRACVRMLCVYARPYDEACVGKWKMDVNSGVTTSMHFLEAGDVSHARACSEMGVRSESVRQLTDKNPYLSTCLMEQK